MAIQRISLRSTAVSICDMQVVYHYSLYGRSSLHRFMAPGRLAKCMTSAQWDRPSSNFRTTSTTEARP